MPRPKLFNFKNLKIDWTLRDSVIGDMLGCSAKTVYNARRELGIPSQPRQPGSGRPSKVEWWLYDPTKTNVENARTLGCSLSYIQVLKNAPKVKQHIKRLTS